MNKTDENLLHLGADLDKNFVLSFRDYCRSNEFKQKALIQRLAEWWLSLDQIDQDNVYRKRFQEISSKLPKIPEPTITESIETIKTFVRYKIPSPEEQREIESLRQALETDPKNEIKKKRG